MKNEQGICPFCGSENLGYGCMELEDGEMVYYPWTCNNCKREGEEWYELNFQGHNIITKDGDNMEVEEVIRQRLESEV